MKTTPEEFVVREATDLRIRRQPAPYRVYLLEKRDWNTHDALMRIGREKGVAYDRISYGGKKDRHAHTVQYVTVQHPADLSLTAKGYSLKALGYSAEAMGPSHILANRFEILIRELSAAEAGRLAEGVGQAKELGVPNYFDDQRFGNLDPERGFIAERMLQGRWEEAAQIALTAIYPEESREAKERKRAIRERWGDWEACLALAQTGLEQRAFEALRAKAGSFREALETVHRETAGLWAAAYQSFLFNETLRRLIGRRNWGTSSVRGAAGEYLFVGPEGSAGLRELFLPLPGRGMRFADQDAGEVFEALLAERRLRPVTLERELLPGLTLKASPRPALVLPQSLSLEGPEPDDRYPGKQKAWLRFALPRGSYATMLIKRIFAP